MSREEAISIMNVIVHMLEQQYDTDRIEEAVEMAIKALEQQPIVVMGDMIPPKCHRAEWIKTYTYYNEGWKCSNCGNFSHIRLRTCHNCLAEIEVQNDK